MNVRVGLFVVVGLVCFVAPQASGVAIETVTVGNPGNADDIHGDGYGGVDYTYNIGKYEVTAGQYCEFLNAVAATDTYLLWNTHMWSQPASCKIERTGSSGSYSYSVAVDRANRPVSHLSWGDAARFANWLHNGQPTGAQDLTTTEDGSYLLNGATLTTGLMNVWREADATWVIPSEDEWYKAAYHKNNGATGNYWDYPTQADEPNMPSNDLIDPDPGNNATFYDAIDETIGSPYYRTEVGAHENSDSPYGTFDQGGNVYEWTEGRMRNKRVVRGGSYYDYYWYTQFGAGLRAAERPYDDPVYEHLNLGFRVALVPEPATLVLTVTNGTWGSIELDPNDPNFPPFVYPLGTGLTLTATPIPGRSFRDWTIFDPNYPGDANYAAVDTNTVLQLPMVHDWEVRARFKCSSGMAPMLPIMLGVLGVFVLLRRRA